MQCDPIDPAQAVRMFANAQRIRETVAIYPPADTIPPHPPGAVDATVDRLLDRLPSDPLRRLHALDVATGFYREELALQRARYETLRQKGLEAMSDHDLRLSAAFGRSPTEAALRALCQSLELKAAHISFSLSVLEGLAAALQACPEQKDLF